MKRTDLKEIKNMEIKDLVKKIKDTKGSMAGLFMARSEGAKGSKDIKQVYKKRKDIAQMLTIVRQKEMLEEIKSSDISLQSSVIRKKQRHRKSGKNYKKKKGEV